MVTRATKAGVLGLVSLAIPSLIYLGSNYLSLGWTVFYYGFQQGYGTYFSYLTQFAPIDEALSALTFVLVLVGAILLMALRRSPRAGASLLLAGLVVFAADTIYGEFAYGIEALIPVGVVVLLVATILGFKTKVSVPMNAPVTGTSSTESLVKLKGLLDSGAITKEEFEEQKKRILGA